MSLITYPLNNIDYTAEDAELFHCTRTSGIWAENSFSISVTGADNNVTIGKGIAWINNEEFSGKVAALKSAEVVDLGVADGTYPRIDVVALQFNVNNNATDIIVKKGTAGSQPVRPAIVRTGSTYELYLASVYRPAGATVITASNITDLRMDSSVCGLMADSVTKVDMKAIRSQLMGLVKELEDAIQNIVVGEIVPIAKGGTGANTVEEARQNLNFIGYNPITDKKLDTPETWASYGTGIAYVSGDILEKQPYNYGFVINNVYDQYVSQVFVTNDGKCTEYRRTGDLAGWHASSKAWIKSLDENNGITFSRLWKNASVESTFPPQRIYLGKVLDSVSHILVTFRTSVEYAGIASVIAPKEYQGRMITAAAGGSTLRTRTFVASVDKDIEFLAGYSGSTINNDSCIPHEIFAIKGVML